MIFAFSPAIYKFSFCLNTLQMPVLYKTLFAGNWVPAGSRFSN